METLIEKSKKELTQVNEEAFTNVVNKYKASYGSEMIVVRAPGRINLIGEHIDYQGQVVLPGAIQNSLYFAMGKRADSIGIIRNAHSDVPVVIEKNIFPSALLGWEVYFYGAVNLLTQMGYTVSGFNCIFDSNIPIGKGLSSSAALCCGVLSGLCKLNDIQLSEKEIVFLAQKIENEYLGLNCGIMDFYACMFGQENSLIALDCATAEHEVIPYHNPDYSLILIDSGIKHSLVKTGYNDRRRESKQAFELIRCVFPEVKSYRDISMNMLLSAKNFLSNDLFLRAKYVVEEIQRVKNTIQFIRQENWDDVIEMMNEGNRGLREDYKVSCVEIDFLTRRANEISTKIGARMMGGGFGGSVIALVPAEMTEDFAEEITMSYKAHFNKEAEVFPVILDRGLEIINL